MGTHRSAGGRKVISGLVSLMVLYSIFLTTIPAGADPSPTGATIVSDQLDYPPGATVTLTGAGWAATESVRIIVNDTIGQTWKRDVTVTADESGAFTDVFTLPEYFVSDYDVTATGPTSGAATTTFTDALGTASKSYAHWSDEPLPGDWNNNILNDNKSNYFEGEVIPHVFIYEGKNAEQLVNGQTYSFNVTYNYYQQNTDAGGFAYMTQYDLSRLPTVFDWASPAITPTGDSVFTNGGGMAAGANFYTVDADITAITAVTYTGTGTKDGHVTITFNYTGQTGGNGTYAAIYYGLYIAKPGEVPNQGAGKTNGASAWSGGSLQTTTDIGGSGAESIQLAPAAIIAGEISGLKFNDLNENGTKDTGESGLPGWTICLDSDADPNNGNLGCVLTSNGTTDDQDGDGVIDPVGFYYFSVTPGTYYVWEVNQDGWTQTAPSTVYYGPLTVSATTPTYLNQNFGNFFVPPDENLVVTKTASTSLTRTYSWTIDKSPDGEYWKFIGDPATSHGYTVSVDKTTTDSAWAVSGTISITNPSTNRNPASITSVTDLITPGDIAATVDCGDLTFPYPLEVGATLECSYSADLPNADTRTNTATVDAEGDLGNTATASVDFTSATVNVVGYDEINVTDTNGESWGPVSVDTSWEYSKDFSCPTDPAAYTDGVYNAPDAVNTATITETGASETATVKLHCYAPVPSKTADASFTRTHTWDITKDYDGTYDLSAGETVTHDYLVKVTKTTVDSGFVVSGVITVVNPNPKAAMTVSLADSVGGTAATLDCGGTLTVPAESSATCGYSATLGSATNGTNTATVTLNSIGFTATKDYTFVANVVGYDAINVTDTNGEEWGPLSSTTELPYTKDFTCSSNPSAYTNGTYSFSVTNTAEITETEQSDDATVTINCSLAPLVPSKTAAGTYSRTVTWTLEKSVAPASHTGFAGDSFDSTWTVVADKTDSGPFSFTVTGTIEVYNPAAIAQTFTVSDELDDGTVATVDCPANTVDPLATVTCTYVAYPNDATATLNTATITFAGNPAQTATAPIEWTENLTGYDSGDLTDPRFTYEANISGDTTVTFDETFTCSTDPDDYTDGSYTDTFTNWAYLDGNIDLSASAQVGITCSLQPLVPTKTAAGEWDRTVTWTLTKSVDDDSHTGYAGDSFDSTWTVVADKTDSGPMNFVVAGTIEVYNPAAIAQTFTVGDVLDDVGATEATVTCPSYTVDPLATVTCTYEALPGDATATLNTVTVTAAGNLPQSDDDAIEWTENLTGYDSGDLTDPRFTYENNISGDTTVDFDETFTCPTDASLYTNGVLVTKYTNTAYLDSNIGLSASDDVTVTCYLPATAKVVKTTTEGPEDIGQFPFTFELYDPSGTLVETKTLSAAGNVTFDREIKTAGTWTIVETLPSGWVTDDDLECTFSVAFPASAGQTYTCDFDNVEMGRVSVYKLSKGPGDPAPWIDTSKDWVFKIYNGPDGFGGTALATDSTLNDADGILDFDFLNLDPGKTYTICELSIPSGWTAEWKIDTDGDGIPDQVVIPYNPDADGNPSQDLGNRCFDFGAGTSYAVPVGDTLAFQVINEYPGGAPRTPGYWKNWNRCTSGGQAANADRQGGRAEGYTLLEDILTAPGITWDDILSDNFLVPITTCEQAVEILDQRVVTLNGKVGDGKKLASDALRTLAMHLLAAQLNEGNGACINQDVRDVILAAERLLDKYNFDGKKTTEYLTSKDKTGDYAYALRLARYLDAYNNSNCNFSTLPPKP